MDYEGLMVLADTLLEDAGEDVRRLASSLESIDAEDRQELLVSDLLNAWQVFYFYFREDPGDLERERLILEPASSLSRGIVITERDLLEVIFGIARGEPVIIVTDGDHILARYHGTTAYKEAIGFLDRIL